MDLNAPLDGCGSDVAAYALGALTDEEARRFENHLRGCELCRSDVETLRPVVDLLPATAPHVAPPAALKERIMRVVETEARVRARASRRVTARRGARRGAVTLRPMVAMAAAACLLLVGVIVGTTPSRDDGGRVVSGDCIRACASVAMRLDQGRAALEIERMDQPPRGRVYQVWTQRFGEDPRPTDALFSVDTYGNASVGVPGETDGADQILVTDEPPGGSVAPSTAPYLAVRL